MTKRLKNNLWKATSCFIFAIFFALIASPESVQAESVGFKAYDDKDGYGQNTSHPDISLPSDTSTPAKERTEFTGQFPKATTENLKKVRLLLANGILKESTLTATGTDRYAAGWRNHGYNVSGTTLDDIHVSSVGYQLDDLYAGSQNFPIIRVAGTSSTNGIIFAERTGCLNPLFFDTDPIKDIDEECISDAKYAAMSDATEKAKFKEKEIDINGTKIKIFCKEDGDCITKAEWQADQAKPAADREYADYVVDPSDPNKYCKAATGGPSECITVAEFTALQASDPDKAATYTLTKWCKNPDYTTCQDTKPTPATDYTEMRCEDPSTPPTPPPTPPEEQDEPCEPIAKPASAPSSQAAADAGGTASTDKNTKCYQIIIKEDESKVSHSSVFKIITEAVNTTRDASLWKTMGYKYELIDTFKPNLLMMTNKAETKCGSVSQVEYDSDGDGVDDSTKNVCNPPITHTYSYQTTSNLGTAPITNQFGAKSTDPFTPTASALDAQDDPNNPASQYKYGVVFAKPTDVVAFRHTINKDGSGSDLGWPNIKASDGTGPSSGSEHCKLTMTSSYRTEFNPVTGGGMACNDMRDYLEYSPPSKNYAVKHRYITPFDVGQKFVQEAKTNVSWSHTDGFMCLTPRGTSGSSPNQSDGYCSKAGTTKVKTGGLGESSAQINVPYNYMTRPITEGSPVVPTSCTYPKSIPEDATLGCRGTGAPTEGWPNYGMVYAGENFTFNNSVIINPRNNPDVAAADYTTYTKSTKYQIVSFATTPDSAAPSGYSTGTGLPCSYYQGASTKPTGRECIVLSEKDNQHYNKNGDFAVSTDLVEETKVVIDDLPVGTKICFAVAIFPADSHDKPDAVLAASEPGNLDGGAAMKDAGTLWAYGAPYCVTIAKKPNFQVLNSGVYSKGLTTSQSPKLILGSDPVVATTANPLLQSNPVNSATRTVFGSWAEWEVISLGAAKGFGSGAAFGYSAPDPANSRTMGYGGGLQGYGAAQAVNPADILCSVSKMTLANDGCASGSVGSAKVTKVTLDLANLTQITKRYAGAGTVGAGPSDNARRVYHIDYFTNAPGANSEPHQTADSVIVPEGRVYVYDLRSQGDVPITKNVRYFDGPYDAISKLPQAMIFADSLTVMPDVTNIDSWIILNSGGTLATCDKDPETADECTNPLSVNGPVYAENIQLRRSYGAFPGKNSCFNNYAGSAPASVGNSICDADAHPNGWKGSIAPAERFILRIDTFYWAYAQATEVPVATTVHTYEPSVNF